MTTVTRMAFVWSRLALAAVLAAGAACAPAEACPELAAASPCDQGGCGDAPRLVCSDGASFVLFDGCAGFGDAILDDSSAAALVPRIAITTSDERLPAAPSARADVLVVAPKTSPPQT